jgi:hypothetical protein
MLMTHNNEFGSVFEGSHFLSDCQSVLNHMVVKYKVSYSNSNDYHEFLWARNVFISVNKIIPLSLKVLLHFKNH